MKKPSVWLSEERWEKERKKKGERVKKFWEANCKDCLGYTGDIEEDIARGFFGCGITKHAIVSSKGNKCLEEKDLKHGTVRYRL